MLLEHIPNSALPRGNKSLVAIDQYQIDLEPCFFQGVRQPGKQSFDQDDFTTMTVKKAVEACQPAAKAAAAVGRTPRHCLDPGGGPAFRADRMDRDRRPGGRSRGHPCGAGCTQQAGALDPGRRHAAGVGALWSGGVAGAGSARLDS